MTSIDLRYNGLSGTVDFRGLPAGVTSVNLYSNNFDHVIFSDAMYAMASNEHGLQLQENMWACPLPVMPSWLGYPGCLGIRFCLCVYGLHLALLSCTRLNRLMESLFFLVRLGRTLCLNGVLRFLANVRSTFTQARRQHAA